MLRLNKITFEGFKDPERIVTVEFSPENVTIIYGENGSGKTTFLKAVQAVLKFDLKYLHHENIKDIKVSYSENGYLHEYSIDMGDESVGFHAQHTSSLMEAMEKSCTDRIVDYASDGGVFGGDFNEDIFEENYSVDYQKVRLFYNHQSILFGVHRGLVSLSKEIKTAIEDLHKLKEKLGYKEEEDYFSSVFYPDFHKENQPQNILKRVIKQLRDLPVINRKYDDEHVSIDYLSIDEIEQALQNAYKASHGKRLSSIRNAFSETLDDAIYTEESSNFSDNFWERLYARKSMILSLLQKIEKTKTQQRLIAFLDQDQKNADKEHSVFKALLINVLEKIEADEQENLDAKAINVITDKFNQYLIRGKKLLINEAGIKIEAGENSYHSLQDLSSGERHLLSFLTLFLIIARGKDIFLIDEPEISMSMRWQRELLPLLHEFSPNSQIIVATHSPEIVNGHNEYLRELR